MIMRYHVTGVAVAVMNKQVLAPNSLQKALLSLHAAFNVSAFVLTSLLARALRLIVTSGKHFLSDSMKSVRCVLLETWIPFSNCHKKR